MKDDLNKRLFEFAVQVLKFLPRLLTIPENKIIRYQLAKSSTSSGANYEESQAGSSKADFNNTVRISLREMRESNYWLRIINSLLNIPNSSHQLNNLISESEELKRILGSISTKARNKKSNKI